MVLWLQLTQDCRRHNFTGKRYGFGSRTPSAASTACTRPSDRGPTKSCRSGCPAITGRDPFVHSDLWTTTTQGRPQPRSELLEPCTHRPIGNNRVRSAQQTEAPLRFRWSPVIPPVEAPPTSRAPVVHPRGTGLRSRQHRPPRASSPDGNSLRETARAPPTPSSNGVPPSGRSARLHPRPPYRIQPRRLATPPSGKEWWSLPEYESKSTPRRRLLNQFIDSSQ